ncbi:TIGR02757 family protein [bacterium]|nr:TIGR02757 family protein [bacterium]
MRRGVDGQTLERLYERYNRREFVHPDPVEFLYGYEDPCDREIVGLIASALAYGRVAQILKSVSYVLERFGPAPREFLLQSSEDDLRSLFSHFKHRFTTGDDVAEMLIGAKRLIEHYGSLYHCFVAGLMDEHETVLPALATFAEALMSGQKAGGRRNSLVPSPKLGSACKRLNLFLRWMVRKDEVDPGGWGDVPKSKLIVPLDTHIHRIGLALGFTNRRNADMQCALEITNAFKRFAPFDPVRYDFALTRLGIRRDADLECFLNEFGQGRASADV